MARDLPKLRAVTYTRVSTQEQAARGNTSTQQVRLDKVIQDEGFELVASFSDEGVSGKTLFDRPAFAQVLKLAKDRAFDVLVVWDSDRIGRPENREEAARLQDFLQQHNIRLFSPSSGLVDLGNEDQSFFAALRLQIAALDRLKMLKRTAAGRLQKAKLGWRFGSKDPYGYRWVPSDNATKGSYQIVESEAKVIREAVELCLAGHGIPWIVSVLRERGYTTREGKPFAKSSIAKFLKRTTIAGTFEVMSKSEPGISIPMPPIIDREVWQRVQLATSERKVASKRTSKGDYLLAGLARCGVCGHHMWVVRNRPGRGEREYYRCSTSNTWRTLGLEGPCGQKHHEVRAVDQLVWHQVCQTLGSPDLLAKACSLPDVVGPDQTDSLRSRLQILEELEREVLQRRRLGKISKVACDAELEELSTERQSIERKVESLESDLASRGQGRRVREELLTKAGTLLSEGNKDFQSRRKLLKLLVPGRQYRIVLHLDGSVEIHGVIALSSGVFWGTTVSGRAPKHTHKTQRKDELGRFLPGPTIFLEGA